MQLIVTHRFQFLEHLNNLRRAYRLLCTVQELLFNKQQHYGCAVIPFNYYERFPLPVDFVWQNLEHGLVAETGTYYPLECSAV